MTNRSILSTGKPAPRPAARFSPRRAAKGLWTFDLGLWTLLALLLVLPVTSSAITKRTNRPAAKLPEPQAPDEIPPLKPPLEELPATFWEQHGTGVSIASGFTIAALCGVAVWVLRHRKPAPVIPPDVAALAALAALDGKPETPEVVASTARCLRTYTVAAGELPLHEATTEELLRSLQERPAVPPDWMQDLTGLLRECDTRQFAPVPPPARPGVVKRALDLVKRFELWRHPPPAVPSPTSLPPDAPAPPPSATPPAPARPAA